MKFLLALFAVTAIASAYDFPAENDNFDMRALVADVDALRKFSNCFLDKGPCSEVAATFKGATLDAFATACSKCTKTQKEQFRTFLLGLHKQFPDDFREFKAKYDPMNKHFDRLWTTLDGNNF